MTIAQNRFSLRKRLSDLWSDPATRFALTIFLVLRIGISLWMMGVRTLYNVPLPPDPTLRPYVNVPAEPALGLEVWQRWDTLHYQSIAIYGYGAFDTATFVPPLYPLLMRWTTILTGNTLTAGILVSNLAFILALIVFYRLAELETGETDATKRAVIYLASFPTAFFFIAAYTESLYLLSAILALFAIRRRKWIWAGIWCGFAAMIRLPGAVILAPAGYEAWLAWRSTGSRRPWLAVVLGLSGAAIFPLYLWLILDLAPWSPLQVQSNRFQGGFTFPGLNIIAAARQVIQGNFVQTNLMEFLFTVVFIFLVILVWLKLPRVYGVYCLAWMGLYLTRMGGTYPLLGMTRYVLVFFPVFILLGIWGRNSFFNRVVLYGSWSLLLYFSAQFALWGWAG